MIDLGSILHVVKDDLYWLAISHPFGPQERIVFATIKHPRCATGRDAEGNLIRLPGFSDLPGGCHTWIQDDRVVDFRKPEQFMPLATLMAAVKDGFLRLGEPLEKQFLVQVLVVARDSIHVPRNKHGELERQKLI